MKPYQEFTEKEIRLAEVTFWRKTCKEKGLDPNDIIIRWPSDKPNKWLDLKTGKYIIKKR